MTSELPDELPTELPNELVRLGIHPEGAAAYRAASAELLAHMVRIAWVLNAMRVWIPVVVEDKHWRLRWSGEVKRFSNAHTFYFLFETSAGDCQIAVSEGVDPARVGGAAPLLGPLLGALGERMRAVAPALEKLAPVQAVAGPLGPPEPAPPAEPATPPPAPAAMVEPPVPDAWITDLPF